MCPLLSRVRRRSDARLAAFGDFNFMRTAHDIDDPHYQGASVSRHRWALAHEMAEMKKYKEVPQVGPHAGVLRWEADRRQVVVPRALCRLPRHRHRLQRASSEHERPCADARGGSTRRRRCSCPGGASLSSRSSARSSPCSLASVRDARLEHLSLSGAVTATTGFNISIKYGIQILAAFIHPGEPM